MVLHGEHASSMLVPTNSISVSASEVGRLSLGGSGECPMSFRWRPGAGSREDDDLCGSKGGCVRDERDPRDWFVKWSTSSVSVSLSSRLSDSGLGGSRFGVTPRGRFTS